MKNESLSPTERVEIFVRELGLALRRIAAGKAAPDLPPVVQPVESQEGTETDVNSQGE
jgi:hypothetical protein